MAEFAEFIRKGGRPRCRSEYRKRRVTLMLDPDVLAHFKAGGKGWQTRDQRRAAQGRRALSRAGVNGDCAGREGRSAD